MASRTTEGLSVRERVYQLIVDSIYEHHRPASRGWLMQQLKLSSTAVDEHIKNLRADQRIFSETPGYYLPVPELPADRAITVTVLPNGMRKLEWGDEMATFTPHEWSVIGDLSTGAAQRSRVREHDQQQAAELAQAVTRIKQQAALIDDLTRAVSALNRRAQPDLFGETTRTPPKPRKEPA